jgi:hypothetical protein
MYKGKCGFSEEIKACNFKEDDCTPYKCDLYRVDFYSQESLNREYAKLVKEVDEYCKTNEFTMKHPLKDRKKSKQVMDFLGDRGAGKKIIKKALEWHNEKGKA